MLDANDVRLLEKMFDRKFDEKIGGLRDEMHQGFKVVRQELGQKIDGLRAEMHHGFDEVHKEFVQVRAEMARGFEKSRDDIIDVIDQNIQPQLTSSVSRINRLERKTA